MAVGSPEHQERSTIKMQVKKKFFVRQKVDSGTVNKKLRLVCKAAYLNVHTVKFISVFFVCEVFRQSTCQH